MLNKQKKGLYLRLVWCGILSPFFPCASIDSKSLWSASQALSNLYVYIVSPYRRRRSSPAFYSSSNRSYCRRYLGSKEAML